MPLLTVAGLGKLYGSDRILYDVSFTLERGEHVALVGANGSGKSTLLRIVAGLEQKDEGRVSLARNALVSYVSQHAEFQGGQTLWEAMLDTFGQARSAEARMRAIESRLGQEDGAPELPDEYRRLSVIAEHAGFDYESRIERVLVGLELEKDQWSQRMAHLSGGQRTRANLARALLKESDILLLDEPTNHLDIAALEWLETYLKTQHTAYIVVAHDRYFLDAVSCRTLELSFQRIEQYAASYTGYLKLREERRTRAARAYQRQQEHIAATEEFVRRFGAGQRSQEAKGRQKRLDRVERLDRPREERRLRVKLDKAGRRGDAVLRLHRLAAGFEGNTLVQGPDELTVAHGARVAIVGPNGAGKTTLARTLMRALPPVAGSFSWAPDVEVAYYEQSVSAVFEAGQTVLNAFQARLPVGEESARSFLGRFLFSGDEVDKAVEDLSGGEQSRLALAVLLYSHPKVMLLDEPTNHLDIPAREALEDSLATFGGSLIFISHDRFLIDRLATEIWSLNNGRLEVYDGTWSDFSAGRHRRRLEYSEPARLQPMSGTPATAEVARPGRHSTAVVAAMHESEVALAPVLKKGTAIAATASIEEMRSVLDEFEVRERELRRLVDELIGAAG